MFSGFDRTQKLIRSRWGHSLFSCLFAFSLALVLPPAATRGQEAPSADPSAVVAKVNGDDVTRAALDEEVGALLGQMDSGQIPPEALAQMKPRLEEQALNQLALKQQLDAYAKTNGIEVPDASIEQQIGMIQSRFPTPEALEQTLSSQGLTIEGLRKEMKKELLLDSAVSHFVKGLPSPGAEEVEKYYQSHLEEFKSEESVTASHILIGFEPEDTAEIKEKKLQQTKQIKEQIAGGAEFAALAKEHSSCPSSAQGGSLGSFGRGQMVPPFEEAAFQLQPGATSDVVETQFGYHLIQVSDHKDGSVQALPEAKPEIEGALKQEAVQGWFQEMVAKAKIERI
jgi:peptidyl-prolyl cis-trans isomerase C